MEVPATSAVMPVAAGEAGLTRLWREVAESRIAGAALVVGGGLFALALAGPWVAPRNPYDLAQLSILDNMLEPGTRGSNAMLHLLGTDDQGRDLLSAILYGLR